MKRSGSTLSARMAKYARSIESPEFDVIESLARTTAIEDSPEPIGAVYPHRHPTNGIIVKHGDTIAQWGETQVPDMAFSISKEFLVLAVGVALRQGLIASTTELVAPVILKLDLPPEQMTGSETLGDTTCRHLLDNTSGWKGSLWGKHTDIDRQMTRRGMGQLTSGFPNGSRWSLNNIRVNLLALALTAVFEESLEAVMRREIMDPIGASDTWRWNGYVNSFISLGTEAVPVVSGGAHWGGGIYISSSDLALVGRLCAARGQWNGQSLVPSTWFEESWALVEKAPMPMGYMWQTNINGDFAPGAPRSGFAATGGTQALGHNLLWVDPENEIVAVSRWMRSDRMAEFLERMTQYLNDDPDYRAGACAGAETLIETQPGDH